MNNISMWLTGLYRLTLALPTHVLLLEIMVTTPTIMILFERGESVFPQSLIFMATLVLSIQGAGSMARMLHN